VDLPQSTLVVTMAPFTQDWVEHLSLTPLKVETQDPETQVAV
jgi:hypothetical protein